MKAIATKPKSEITSAVVYRVTAKKSREVFYLVRSDTETNVYYEVRWVNDLMAWTCTCPAHRSCKHSRAVQEVILAKRRMKDEERVRYNNYEMSLGII